MKSFPLPKQLYLFSATFLVACHLHDNTCELTFTHLLWSFTVYSASTSNFIGKNIGFAAQNIRKLPELSTILGWVANPFSTYYVCTFYVPPLFIQQVLFEKLLVHLLSFSSVSTLYCSPLYTNYFSRLSSHLAFPLVLPMGGINRSLEDKRKREASPSPSCRRCFPQ